MRVTVCLADGETVGAATLRALLELATAGVVLLGVAQAAAGYEVAESEAVTQRQAQVRARLAELKAPVVAPVVMPAPVATASTLVKKRGRTAKTKAAKTVSRETVAPGEKTTKGALARERIVALLKKEPLASGVICDRIPEVHQSTVYLELAKLRADGEVEIDRKAFPPVNRLVA